MGKLDGLRGLVRPVLTLSGWLVVLILAITNEAVREFFLGSVSIMIGFWFGSRKASQ